MGSGGELSPAAESAEPRGQSFALATDERFQPDDLADLPERKLHVGDFLHQLQFLLIYFSVICTHPLALLSLDFTAHYTRKNRLVKSNCTTEGLGNCLNCTTPPCPPRKKDS